MQRWIPSLVALLIGFALGQTAVAQEGRSWIWRPPASAVKPYGPEVQQYVVVTPAPLPLPPPTLDEGAGLTHYPWRQYSVDAPVYPWGWFGAQWTPSTETHTRYYDRNHDWIFQRGW